MPISKSAARLGPYDPVAVQATGERAKNSHRKNIKALSQVQFEVTRGGATEVPFDNAYWDHDEAGIYVNLVSGEPLFGSLDKFDSNCG